jgi:hypothetical protein
MFHDAISSSLDLQFFSLAIPKQDNVAYLCFPYWYFISAVFMMHSKNLQ